MASLLITTLRDTILIQYVLLVQCVGIYFAVAPAVVNELRTCTITLEPNCQTQNLWPLQPSQYLYLPVELGLNLKTCHPVRALQ